MLLEELKYIADHRSNLAWVQQEGSVARIEQARKHLQSTFPQIEAVHAACATSALKLGPCDRSAAEKAVANLYSKFGYEPPIFVWCDSPFEGFSTVALFDVLGFACGHNRSAVANFDQLPDTMKVHKQLQKLSTEILGDLQKVQREYVHFQLFVNESLQTLGLRRYHSNIFQGSIDGAVRDTNARLGFENAGQLLQVHETVRRHLEGTDLANVWNDFASYLQSLSETEYAKNVTVRQNNRIRFFVQDGYSLSNFVTTFEHYRLFEEELRAILGAERVSHFEELKETMSHCGWWWPTKELCVMVDRPVAMQIDEVRLRLHSDSGQAITFSDGWGAYSLSGVPVTENQALGRFGLDEISKAKNVEVRRVMIERFGAERYLVESGAEEVQRDQYGVLYKKEVPRDEPLVMVRVTNSTAEPDGTFKDYYLRVPPNMETAKDAVAWTFSMQSADYKPQIES